ncbi:unnamed protein product [Camellia sinensis]
MKWAFERLQRYQKKGSACSIMTYRTAGVALAGLLGTVRAQDRPLTNFVNQKIVIVGAGSLVFLTWLHWLFQELQEGLITTKRKGVDPAAAPFAKAPGEIKGLGLREGANLVKVGTKHNNGKVYPLFELGKAFVFFDKSAECTAVDAFNHAGENIVFASGEPFQKCWPWYGNGKVGLVNQANNIYMFPGIGMGALLSSACLISDGLSQAISECRRRDSEGYFVSSYEKYITAEVGAAVVRATVAKELAEGRCDVGPKELRQMSKRLLCWLYQYICLVQTPKGWLGGKAMDFESVLPLRLKDQNLLNNAICTNCEETVEYVKPNMWYPVYSPLLFMRNKTPSQLIWVKKQNWREKGRRS